MKNIFKMTFLLSLVVLLNYSCTDESKFKNPVTHHLGNGAFARFEEGTAPTVLSFVDPSAASFTRTIYDPAGNISSYSLSVTATLTNGQVLHVNDYFTTTTLPTTIEVSAQNIADALGLTIADLNFGDNFQFVGTAVRNDGVEFVGLAPALNDDGSISIGNTEPNLYLDSYTNAMNFGFTFACSAFTNTDLEGTWTVEALGFAGTFNETIGDTRQIIAGPEANQITIVGGEYPTGGGDNDDLIITFAASGAVTAVNDDGVAFGPGNAAGLATNTYLLERGLLLPCIDRIDLTMNFSPFSANPHPFVLTR